MAALAFPAIDPVIFAVGPFAVRWYGVAYLVGFVGAAFVLRWLARTRGEGLSDEDVISAVLYAAVGLILGARVGYQLFYGFAEVLSDPVSVVRVWEGGMSFHGGLVGLTLAGLVFARRRGIPFLRIADMVAVGAPIGLFSGRVANFINGELWGRVTDVPWGMVFPGAGALPRHPSQLYQAFFEGVVLFVLLVALSRRRWPDGFLLGAFLSGYGVVRFSMEFFREPDAHLGTVLGPLSMGQVLTIPVFIAGVCLLVLTSRRRGGEFA